jgi:2-phospho-L-lactate/phosphoenolpyruvate guanylyltransferase
MATIVSGQMRTAAILPVKRFARAKQRLGASVADPLRLELARAMVADVLLALSETSSLELTIVVTGESSVADAARTQGALVVPEGDSSEGQSAAVTLGIHRALTEGIERVLCIPGDCPALDPAELDELLSTDIDAPDRHDEGRAPAPTVHVAAGDATGSGHVPEVVIVPDRHGTGTNGLLLTPPDAISPSFGPGSCERHRALALAAGVACDVARPSSLLLDIDTGADLAALRDRLAGTHTRAERTRAVLGQPERTDALPLPTRA